MYIMKSCLKLKNFIVIIEIDGVYAKMENLPKKDFFPLVFSILLVIGFIVFE